MPKELEGEENGISTIYSTGVGVLIAYKPIIRFIDPCASSVEMVC